MMKEIPAELLLHLSEKYGTPLWVYDADTIRARIEQLRAFDVIRYAQKACSNLSILKLMRQHGAFVDSVSLGEIERAQRAGYAANSDGAAQIVYTADIFDRTTLDRVVADRIEVNVGSVDMLHQIGARAPGHRVWIRINPGFGHGHSKKTNTGGESSKHGIWYTELRDAVGLVKRYGLHLVGLHMHIGSGVDYSHLEQVCGAMTGLVRETDCDFESISAGGGLSVPYRPGEKPVDTNHYFKLWDAVRKDAERHVGHPVRLEIEPGRFLVAESGLLLAEIRATKRMGGNFFALVDAGFNDLMRPAMYGSYHAMSVLTRDGRLLGPSGERPTVVAGPLCESGDVFTQQEDAVVVSRDLPVAEVGDYLIFHDTGAFGAAMSSNYNSRPYAPEFLIDGQNSRLIRRRQTLDEMLETEIV
jgi:diaminopimelate decarboxylase